MSMWTKHILHLIDRPTVNQQTRADFLAQDNPEFVAMANELGETRHIAPARRQEIYDAIDTEINRLKDQS